MPTDQIFEAGIVVDFFRSHLKQVVSIHRIMFERLLFKEDWDVGPELAELFEDAGKTYLQIAERIGGDVFSPSYSRLNIFRNPASYSLGGLFNLNSSLNQGLLPPKTQKASRIQGEPGEP